MAAYVILKRLPLAALLLLLAAQQQAISEPAENGQVPLLNRFTIDPGSLEFVLPPAIYSEALARGCEARFNRVATTYPSFPQLTSAKRVVSSGKPQFNHRDFSLNGSLLCTEAWQGEPGEGLLRRVSVHGETVSLEYGGLGRLIRRTHEDTLHESESRITRYEYPAAGVMFIDGPRDDVNDVRQVMFDEDGNVVRFVNPAGHRFEMEYDAQGRLAVWTGPNGDRREYEYDELGNMTLERLAVGTRQETAIKLEHDAAGRMVASRRQGERTIRRRYDTEGRLASLSVEGGESLLLRYALDGTLQGIFASEGFRVSPTGIDEGILRSPNYALHRAVRQGLPSLPNPKEAASVQRDLLGRLQSATLTDGTFARFEHNGFGEVVAAKVTSGMATRHAYDVAGNRVRDFGGDGSEIWRAYDMLGRAVREDVRLPGNSPYSIDYRYDSCANGIGRLCEINSNAGATKFDYDVLGNAIIRDAIVVASGETIRTRSGFEAQRSTSAPAMSLSAAATTALFRSIVFYSGVNCRGWGHTDVHVDSLAEAWYMGYMSYSAWANVTVYLESGEVLTGEANVCVLIDVPSNLGVPSPGYVYTQPPPSSPSNSHTDDSEEDPKEFPDYEEPADHVIPTPKETDNELPESTSENWVWGIYRRSAAFNGVCKQSETTDRARLEGSVSLAAEIEVTTKIGSPDTDLCVDGNRSRSNINATSAHEKKHAAFYVELANRYQDMLGTVHDNLTKCEGERKRILGEFNDEYALLKQRQAAHTDFCGEQKTTRQCVVPGEDYNAIINGLIPKPATIEVPSDTYPCSSNLGL